MCEAKLAVVNGGGSSFGKYPRESRSCKFGTHFSRFCFCEDSTLLSITASDAMCLHQRHQLKMRGTDGIGLCHSLICLPEYSIENLVSKVHRFVYGVTRRNYANVHLFFSCQPKAGDDARPEVDQGTVRARDGGVSDRTSQFSTGPGLFTHKMILKAEEHFGRQILSLLST